MALILVLVGSWHFMQGQKANYMHRELWQFLEEFTNKLGTPNPTPWSLRLSWSSQLSFHGDQVAPVILKMSNFGLTMKAKKQWYSSEFFAFPGGFKICIRVDIASYNNSNNGHVIVSLHKVDGPYDTDLLEKYSLRGVFTLELLNQWSDTDHHTNIAAFVSLLSLYCDRSSWSISCDTIAQYIVNDSVYFRVSYEHLSSILWSHIIGDISWTVVGYLTISVVFNMVIWVLKKDFISSPIAVCAGGIVIIGSILGAIVWIVITMLLTGIVYICYEGFVHPMVGTSKKHHDHFVRLMIMCFIMNGALARIYLVDVLSISEIVPYMY